MNIILLVSNSYSTTCLLYSLGCGNGKYIAVNPKVIKIGLDSCSKLVQIAVQQGFDACVGDCLRLPFRSNVFNAAICIAVIHHLATEDRRIKALKELVRIVEPGGKVLIYVWAFEQKKRKVMLTYTRSRGLLDVKGCVTV